MVSRLKKKKEFIITIFRISFKLVNCKSVNISGTRAEIHEYKRCNLGRVKANAVVTRGGYGYNETHINAYINLFMYAQTFYGRKISDEFRRVP